MALIEAEQKVINYKVPGQATVGRSQDAYNKLTADGFARMGNNDAEAGIAGAAQGSAQEQAAGALSRDPQAVADEAQKAREASGANGHQMSAIEMARQQAMGQAPSAGAYQLQAGLDMGSQQQAAMARGARGSAGIATAGANANANVSNLQQNAFTNAGMLRSQDMARGRGLYASLTGQAREQDINAVSSTNEMNAFNKDLNAQHWINMGNAANNIGDVANQHAQEDQANFGRGTRPMEAQDQANAAFQNWRNKIFQDAAATNAEEND